MTTELILLLSLYATIILTSLLGENGPVRIFSTAGPVLASRVERNIATGYQFVDKTKGDTPLPTWLKPE
ncbi:MAG: hypothetical protein HAW63_02860 [Bdellovibrionaceae bacterium]|nr:hypothetical protein [Pseudobdellovibrionaceae bacterium]